jgi:Lrp/AsnC family transcriptional regulator for asnA, asnC and gidA
MIDIINKSIKKRTILADNYEIDRLDKQILGELLKDARRPYLEIARKLKVSGGTIHQRMEKMKELGVVKGSKIIIDYKKLGQGMVVFLGLHLHNAKDISRVVKKLQKLDEVTETHYTTGNYALLTKVIVRDIDHFHNFLTKKLQVIEEIKSTESLINLDSPIERDLDLLQI